MSTDYFLACFDCKVRSKTALASGSAFYGYIVDGDYAREWLGHGKAVGTHERHDVRIVHEQADLPWEDEFGLGPLT